MLTGEGRFFDLRKFKLANKARKSALSVKLSAPKADYRIVVFLLIFFK